MRGPLVSLPHVHPVVASEAMVRVAAPPARAGKRRRAPWLGLYAPIPIRREIALGAAGWAGLFALWYGVVAGGLADARLLPYPHEVAKALVELVTERGFVGDVAVSVRRIFVSFAVACAIAVPLGVAMGAFLGVEALLNPLVSPARYLPAPSFAPLLLMWLGTGRRGRRSRSS